MTTIGGEIVNFYVGILFARKGCLGFSTVAEEQLWQNELSVVIISFTKLTKLILSLLD